jgi:hypothetical protein
MLPTTSQSEDAVMTRVLLCGFCLIAIQASSAAAQTQASATDNPVPTQPAVIDQPARPANKVPEVIREPDSAAQPKATSAPATVLTPPTIDLRFLRAIRLDWDEVGLSK